MLRSHLDHLVITAPSLAEGIEHVRTVLGVAPAPGGKHPRMGTHNALLRLGERAYLEVIAVDPAAPAPDHPRWFGLDRPPAAPRLALWVARTDDIHTAAAASPAYGRVEPMERGALAWEITLPEGGGLVWDGVAPLLIQWRSGGHPASQLPESGCALAALEGRHPRAAEITRLAEAIGLQAPFRATVPEPGGRSGLVARIQTPAGLRTLGA